MKYLRALPQTGGAESGDDAPVRFVASTETDGLQDGQVLKMEDWDLSRFERHGPILWGHQYSGTTLPLGTGKAFFDKRELLVDIKFDRLDPFAMQVRRKALGGMIGASVGWDVVKKGGRNVNQLLEVSMVPVPMDPNATLAVGRSLLDDDAFLIELMSKRIMGKLQAERQAVEVQLNILALKALITRAAQLERKGSK